MSRKATSLASYARAVEKLWIQYLDRPVILSPRDWSVIADWHERGVPLQVIREAIDAFAEKRRKSPPRGLGALGPTVNESFGAIAAGHLMEPPERSDAATLDPDSETADACDPPTAAVECHLAAAWPWQACLDELVALEEDASALRARLLELRERQQGGATHQELDAALDASLPELAPASLLEAVSREVEGRLSGFRDRMPAAAFESTRRRTLVDGLRLRLHLPRLAGSGNPS